MEIPMSLNMKKLSPYQRITIGVKYMNWQKYAFKGFIALIVALNLWTLFTSIMTGNLIMGLIAGACLYFTFKPIRIPR
jgi:hypothetical protein